MTVNCFLCQRKCELYPSPNFDGTIYNCPSCGPYGITRSAAITYDDKKFSFARVRASHIAAERYVHKESPFFIATCDGGCHEFLAVQSPLLRLETLLDNYPKDSVEILDRTLLNLGQLNVFPGQSFKICRIACGQESVPERSISFCRNWQEFIDLILLIEREGYIEIESVLREAKTGRALSNIERAYAATQFVKLPLLILTKGLQRIRELKSGNHQSGATDTMSSPLNITATNSNIQIGGHNAQQTITVTNNVNDAIAELHKILEEKVLADDLAMILRTPWTS